MHFNHRDRIGQLKTQNFVDPLILVIDGQWRTVNFWSGGGGTNIFVKGLKGYGMAGMELGGPRAKPPGRWRIFKSIMEKTIEIIELLLFFSEKFVIFLSFSR